MDMIGSPGESVSSPSMKKHKKHKKDRYEDDGASLEKPGLKLILKVGGQNTPEHNPEFQYTGQYAAEQSELLRSHHKKSKKKKKKKDRSKDKERKHKHHHKDKKRKREDVSSDADSHSLPTLQAGIQSQSSGLSISTPGLSGIVTNSVISNPIPQISTFPMETEENQLQIKEEEASGSLSSPKPDMAQLGSPYREPRTCVIKKIQERNAVQRMLEHFLRAIEKKDPQQFFAWPVTDNIAPGYSSIITNPMDCSTMRQKIDDNEYRDLPEFMEDFKLMCNNAMKYNHADTIYYKASKKLLHAGLKLAQADKCAWILSLMPELTKNELGFEVPPEIRAEYKVESTHLSPLAKRKMPPTKFEAIPDDLEPEEVLARAQKAAREAKAKLQSAPRRGGPNMGFLRQRKDGTTHLNILVGGDGVIPGTKKRPVLLGQLTGKLTEGTGALQGFREDRRNIAKPVKPLYYGAFGSYAPSYDSAFANLSKEESELVYQTYGSDAAVQYAESILDFARDCDYSVYMVDSLLDLMTGGEHSKTKKNLEERKSLREEEEAVKTVIESSLDRVKIDVQELKSLSELGIDVEFLDNMTDIVKSSEEHAELQDKLNNMSGLLDKLHKIQHQRLSQSVPAHLSNLSGPSDEEVNLANTITTNLSDIAKRLNPSDVVPVAGVRKALGVVGPEPESSINVQNSLVASAVPPPTQEVDLEAELRQYLESENNLVNSPLRGDDKTIEEILME